MNASTRATNIQTFELEITSGTERLYNNGLSQVRIQITIESDIPLTAEERNSLRLVDANTRQLIPVVEDSSVPVTEGWGASTQKNDYDYCPPGAAGTEPAASETLHRYLQTADFANARKSVGACITVSKIDVYSMDRTGGKGEVEVVPVQFERPGLAAWKVEWDNPDRFDVGGSIKVTIFHLGMVDNGRRYAIRTIAVAPDSWASTFRWLSPNSSTGAFCGYAPPPDAQTPQQRFNYSHEQHMGDYRPATNNYARTDCASVAFVSRLGGLPWSGAVNNLGSIYVLGDQYGTLHRLRVNILTSLDKMDLTQA